MHRSVATFLLSAFWILFGSQVRGDVLEYTWDACPDHGGVLDVTMPCADPDGVARLYVSFVLSDTVKSPVGVEFKVNMETGGDALPAFWSFETEHSAGCHGGLAFGCDAVTCQDTHAPLLDCATFVGSFYGFAGPSEGTITGGSFRLGAVPGDDLLPDRRYLLGVLTFRTAGAAEAGGACAGCSTPLRFGVTLGPALDMASHIRIVRDDGSNYYVTYDGPCVSVNGGAVQCQPTPVRGTSWGAVKIFYR